MTEYPDSIRTARKLLDQQARINELEAERARWTREAIITALVAKYGPHKAYSHETRSYEPTGSDAEASCMITFQDTDGDTSIRALTYGEIADALTGDRQ